MAESVSSDEISVRSRYQGRDEDGTLENSIKNSKSEECLDFVAALRV
jgi:hypothetical protein